MMNWAVGRDYLDRTPLRRGAERLIRKQYEDNQLRRRLSETEEAKLLNAASAMLRSMIIAALNRRKPSRRKHRIARGEEALASIVPA
jgi:hypothetical protein